MLLGKEAEEAIDVRKRLVIYMCDRWLNEELTPSLERMVSKVLANTRVKHRPTTGSNATPVTPPQTAP